MELNIEAINKYFDDIIYLDDIHYLVSQINSYDGHLDYLDYYDNNEEFFDMYFGTNTIEAVRAVCFGDYRYADDYVKFNSYGNLESANEYEVFCSYQQSKNEIIEAIIKLNIECEDYLDLPEEFID